MPRQDQYPLYGSTFTLYRASPLYHGAQHVFRNFDTYERRLREHLAGDRARSMLLTDLQPEITGTGNLESCDWSLLGDEETENDTVQDDNARGIQISLRFERAKYAAFLLGDQPRMRATAGFTNLPLLLVRMPVALRELFLDFLATSFDTRISSMKLRSSFLSSSLEGLLQQNISTEQADPAIDIEALSKGVGLQLAFPSMAPHLRALDITIPKDDIREFLSRGKQLWASQRRRVASQKQSSQGPPSIINGPFTAALAVYLSNHTAMDLENPAIVLAKVALGPFALASEGKVKVLSRSAAAVEFWEALVTEAHGLGLGENEKTASALPSRNVRGESRSLRQQSVPTEPPPPYELHDPARQRR